MTAANDPRLFVTAKDGPLISIIMPVRNAEPYIAECIRSVLEQSWTNWELLVVNNGSTDGTASILASFTDPRLIVLEEPRPGVSRARNIALARMSGDLFCFLDADDRLPKDALRLRHDLFLRYPEARFADGAMRAFDHITGKPLWVRSPWFHGVPFDALLRLDGSCFSGNTWMIKRDRSQTYRFPEHLNQSEDCAFYLGIARQGTYVSTPREVLLYRIGHQSATSDTRRVHEGYRGLYAWMRDLDPPPTAAQLRTAWKRLRRFMVRDLVRRRRFFAAWNARWSSRPERSAASAEHIA